MHYNVGKTTYEGLGVQGGKVHEVIKGKGVEEQYRTFLLSSVSDFTPAYPDLCFVYIFGFPFCSCIWEQPN